MAERDDCGAAPAALSSGSIGSHGSHVHFIQSQLPDHTSDIVIKPNADGELEVQLGFLQFRHTYEIKFTIDDDLGAGATIDPLANLYARVTSVTPSTDEKGHNIEVLLFAYKEQLLNERITLYNDNHKQLVLVLFARVLGKGKGKPSLRKDIHCVKAAAEDDSDQTDFAGFDDL